MIKTIACDDLVNLIRKNGDEGEVFHALNTGLGMSIADTTALLKMRLSVLSGIKEFTYVSWRDK